MMALDQNVGFIIPIELLSLIYFEFRLKRTKKKIVSIFFNQIDLNHTILKIFNPFNY